MTSHIGTVSVSFMPEFDVSKQARLAIRREPTEVTLVSTGGSRNAQDRLALSSHMT